MIEVSDFRQLIVTSTKTNFVISKTRVNYYRDYKNFDADMFDKHLSHELRNMYSFN